MKGVVDKPVMPVSASWAFLMGKLVNNAVKKEMEDKVDVVSKYSEKSAREELHRDSKQTLVHLYNTLEVLFIYPYLARIFMFAHLIFPPFEALSNFLSLCDFTCRESLFLFLILSAVV